MPRFVRDQWMNKIRDTGRTHTKPTGGDVRSLNPLWKQVMELDKIGVLNNSIKTVEDLEEKSKLANGGTQEKCRNFLMKWAEIMEQNGAKGKGKSSASKSARDVDAAAELLMQAGAGNAATLLRWQRNTPGYGTEKVFSALKDYFVAADNALKDGSPEDYEKLYKALNESF